MNVFSDNAMSSVDLAWLRMERPTNPMAIVGVLTFATRVRFADVRNLLLSRLDEFPRLRQRPVDGVLGGHWELDTHFDIDAHLKLSMLPARAGQSQLEAAVSELASTPLDPRKPMWHFDLVERYRKGSALIVRIHHCYADGMALVRVLLSLTEPTPVASPRIAAHPAADVSSRPETVASWVGDFLSAPLDIAETTVRGALDLAATVLHSAAHPGAATQLAKQGIAAGGELAKLSLLSNDPMTPLKGDLSTRKRVAWAAPLPLDEIKTLSKALDCTINDALLSTIAGALGAYLRAHRFDTAGITVRALLPVNLRGANDALELGNCFGLVFADLPLGIRNPLARLYAVHQCMDSLKRSPQATVVYWLLAALGSTPQSIEDRALEFFTAKASAVVSNVVGPNTPLYFAGAKIEQQFFWVPQSGSIALGMSVLTYNDCIHFGVMADANLLEAQHIVERFTAEYEKLVLVAIGGLSQIP